MNERALVRSGAVSLVLGSIAFFVWLYLRPTPTHAVVQDPARALQEIVVSGGFWVFWQVTVLIPFLLILTGLWVLYRSMTTQRESVWGKFGMTAAVLGTSTFIVLVGTDGFGIREAADAWAEAPPVGKDSSVRIAQALAAVNVGLLGLTAAIFFGVAVVFFGVAILTTDIYNRSYGWSAVVLGAVGTVGGMASATNPSSYAWSIGLIAVPLVLVWMLIMVVILWRRAPAAG